jgi:lysophospholipase L1-like esterase
MSLSPKALGVLTALVGLLVGLFFALADVLGMSGDPNRLGTVQISGMVVGGLLILAGVLVIPRVVKQPVRIKNLGTNLTLVVLSTLITFALIEGAARIYLWHLAPESKFGQYASINQLYRRYGDDFLEAGKARQSPHRYLGYYLTPGYRTDADQHNALGFRGEEIEQPKPVGTYRIVCLGGSTTYSVAVDDYTQSYPYQLQQILRERGYTNVEVVNAGANGYSSWESLVNLSFRVLDLDPDMIIVYHGINDIHSRLVWPPSAYRSDNSGARAAKTPNVRMPPIWEYSTALRALLVEMDIIEPHSALYWTLNPKASTYYADLFEEQYKKGTYPSGVFADVSAQEMLEENPPIYFERNLRSMVAIAGANEIDVVLVTFAYSPLFTKQPRVSSEEYRSAYAEQNEVIRQVAAGTGAYLYDFAQEMPTDEQYFADGRHFTAEGNRLRAGLFAAYLVDSGLLPPPVD